MLSSPSLSARYLKPRGEEEKTDRQERIPRKSLMDSLFANGSVLSTIDWQRRFKTRPAQVAVFINKTRETETNRGQDDESTSHNNRPNCQRHDKRLGLPAVVEIFLSAVRKRKRRTGVGKEAFQLLCSLQTRLVGWRFSTVATSAGWVKLGRFNRARNRQDVKRKTGAETSHAP